MERSKVLSGLGVCDVWQIILLNIFLWDPFTMYEAKQVHHPMVNSIPFKPWSYISTDIQSRACLISISAACHTVTTRAVQLGSHNMMTSSNGNIFLAFCAENLPVTSEFPSPRPVTRSFGVFFDLHLNKRLSKQSRRWWFEMSLSSLWLHCNVSMEWLAVLNPRDHFILSITSSIPKQFQFLSVLVATTGLCII